jgi:hypothetical protein
LTDFRQTRGAQKIPKTILKNKLNTKETPNKGMISVFERFIEYYLRNLTCWEKSKYTVEINSSKSINKDEFSSRNKTCWVL